ncbi:MAG TPA: type II CAAX endopeptidase family protein [Candidatus Hydrogenedentes bacterium]|nr:type II CAAX endopeptidase family protein [Candidatus Hydrogenedentota bacterium]
MVTKTPMHHSELQPNSEDGSQSQDSLQQTVPLLRFPPWPYLTCREATLMCVALMVLELYAFAVLCLPIAAGGLLCDIPLRQNHLLWNPAIHIAANVWAVIPLFFWAMGRSGRPFRETFGIYPVRWVVLWAATFLGAVTATLTGHLGGIFAQGFPSSSFPFEASEVFRASPNMSCFALVVVAPLTEELLFRGVILQGLLRRRSIGRSCVVSSLLFALIHVNPFQFVPLFLGGLLLAAVQLKTGSLWPSICMHAGFNIPPAAAIMAQARLAATQEAGPPSFPWFHVFAGVLLLAGAVLSFWSRRTRASSEPEQE